MQLDRLVRREQEPVRRIARVFHLDLRHRARFDRRSLGGQGADRPGQGERNNTLLSCFWEMATLAGLGATRWAVFLATGLLFL